MAVRDMVIFPDDRLRVKTTEVTKFDEKLEALVSDMFETMYFYEGIGLAAPQIGISKRLVVIDVADTDEQGNVLMRHPMTLVNPEIVEMYGEVESQEGCLSVKDVYGNVPRYSKVRVRAIDIHGNRVHFKSPNPFVARVLQHEIDHTNGICFVDHIAHDEDAFSLLTDSGDLVACPYSKVVKSGILPDDEDNRTITQ